MALTLAETMSVAREPVPPNRSLQMPAQRSCNRYPKLHEVVETSEKLLAEMRRAIRSFAVPVKRFALHDYLESFEGALFRDHSRYSRAARLMRRFLSNTSIVVEQGDTEGAKSIETIFEQWVFFQVSAALQAAGLSCVSHNSIFEPIARDRFSVDLDRNAPSISRRRTSA